MRLRVLLLSLLLSCVAFSGCSDKGGGDDDAGEDGESREETRQRTALRMSAPSGYDSGAGDSGSDDGGSAGGSGGGGSGAGSGGSGGGSTGSGSQGAGGSDGSGGAGAGSGSGSGDGQQGGEDEGGDGGDTGSGDPSPDPDPQDPAPSQQDPLRALLGGLLPGFDWQDVSDATGADYEASGFYDHLPPLDLEDPRPPSGEDFEGWDPESLLASLHAQGEVGGYTFSASMLEGGAIRHYDVSFAADGARMQTLRSLLLAPDDFVAYVDAGGDLTHVPAQAEASLSGTTVHEQAFRVLPLHYTITGDDGYEARATVFLPLDTEMPDAYWRPVGFAFDDGVHAGSWEFAPRSADDLPQLWGDDRRVAVPYMAGDSVEDLATWDIVLALHGLNLYSEYPAAGVPLPDPSELPGVVEQVADDPAGWLFGSVDDPTGLTNEQYYLFGHDVSDVEGLVAAYESGMQLHHEERHEDRVQWFRLGFAPGLPLPTYVELGSQKDGERAHALRIDLTAVAAEADALMPDDLPGGLGGEEGGGLPGLPLP